MLAPGLGGLEILNGHTPLLHPWPCSQHLEPGTNLVALRLDGPELGAIVRSAESGDQFAGRVTRWPSST